jgi:pyruvate dehydrogenase E1 component beta subunit
VTPPHTPVPATPALEQDYIPSVTQIETAVKTVMEFDTARAAIG